jgi:hypothetical protein
LMVLTVNHYLNHDRGPFLWGMAWPCALARTGAVVLLEYVSDANADAANKASKSSTPVRARPSESSCRQANRPCRKIRITCLKISIGALDGLAAHSSAKHGASH